MLELTRACNSRCANCSIWRHQGPEGTNQLALENADRLFTELGPDLHWLALSGGEVTLFPHFPELLQLAVQRCPGLALVTFTTNGLLPDKALASARAITALGLDCFVTVSLDGDAETHDLQRGVVGNHALALRTSELLREAGINVHFGITLSDATDSFVQQKFAKDGNRIRAVTFAHSGGIFLQENQPCKSSLLRQLDTIILRYKPKSAGEFIEYVYLRLARVFFATGRRIPIPCEIFITSIHVRSNGDVFGCMFLPSVGNIATEPLSRILDQREQMQLARSAACPNCWLNCYAPHSMLLHPFSSLVQAFLRPVKK
ncbi:MAG: hypothetical protein A2Z97_06880 [Bdellovibrionales bacterium GWB1_52_6]|nr:MAG: hypothetical protein A2Z97_06880 [Bdellovibrionales bacterium GWB1_52_6]